MRVGIAIFSYDGALNYGVTGDYDNSPDIGVLCAGIEGGLAELLALAEGAKGPNGGRRAAAPKRAAKPRAARTKPAS